MIKIILKQFIFVGGIMKTLLLWIGAASLSAFLGCSGINATGVTSAVGEHPLGWISPQGTSVSDHPDLGAIKGSYSDANVNYYYDGPLNFPTAVIKLDKIFLLDDVRWKPITDPDMFLAVFQNMKTKGTSKNITQIRGFAIKAHDGQPIGTWYSDKYVYGMRVSISADHKVYASVPNSGSRDKSQNVLYVKKGGENTMFAGGASICVRCHGAA